MTKKYEELTFADDFMFCKVLENNEELCKELIELVLDTKIEIVKEIGTQKAIEVLPDGRGIRLDVCLVGDSRVFNLEMQNAAREDLPRRSRYYQGMIDLNMSERGMSYSDLMDSYIIFFCRFDPFGYGLRRYSVETVIAEDDRVEYNDGTHKVFLSTLPDMRGEISDELRSLLDYINGNEPSGDLARKLDTAVENAKQMKDWRKDYMFLYEIKEDGIAEGLAKGLAKGRAEGLVMAVDNIVKNTGKNLKDACALIGITEDDYRKAKELMESSR